MSTSNVLKNNSESSSKRTLKSQKLLTGVLSLVLVAGMISPAFALTVDNFDEGAVDIDATSGNSDTANNAGLNTDNTIGGDRDTYIESYGLGKVGALTLGAPQDYMSFSTGSLTD